MGKIRSPDVNEGPEDYTEMQRALLFLTFSASGCWTDDYALGLLTLKEGGNPLVASDWTKKPTPVFTQKPSAGAFGPGHNSFSNRRTAKKTGSFTMRIR
jgi:GH43 family beta-xylosidase